MTDWTFIYDEEYMNTYRIWWVKLLLTYTLKGEREDKQENRKLIICLLAFSLNPLAISRHFCMRNYFVSDIQYTEDVSNIIFHTLEANSSFATSKNVTA
jgi:hypothetical protein